MTAIDPRIGLSHPGGDLVSSERRTGYKLGIAASWTVLRDDVRQPPRCPACLAVLERLGNAGPDLVIGVQQEKAD